jgi:hypothetical protein
MNILITLLLVLSSSLAIASDAIPKTEILLQDIFPNYPPVQVLNGVIQKAPEKSCTVVFTRRNGLILGDYQDKSVDLAFFVEGKIVGTLHLDAQLVPFAIAYEAELEVDVKSNVEVRIFTSIGHLTDQYIGYNSYAWILKRLSNDVLNVTLNTGWADDDGGSGGADYSCAIASKFAN